MADEGTVEISGLIPKQCKMSVEFRRRIGKRGKGGGINLFPAIRREGKHWRQLSRNKRRKNVQQYFPIFSSAT